MLGLGLVIDVNIVNILCERLNQIEVIEYVLNNYNIDVNEISFATIEIMFRSGLMKNVLILLYNHGMLINKFIEVMLENYCYLEYNVDFMKYIYNEFCDNDNINLDNEMISKMLKMYLTLELLEINDVEYLIQRGADPRYNNDEILKIICQIPGEKLNLVKYLVEECGCDVNSNNSAALERAILNNYETITKYLLDKQSIITDSVITNAIHSTSNKKYIDLLIQYGVSMDRMTQIFLKSLGSGKIIFLKKMINRNINLNYHIEICDLNDLNDPNGHKS